MNKVLILTLAWMAGGAIGVIFFGGLWWTIRRACTSENAGFWFLGSMLARMGIALAGFYFVSGGDWQRLVFCLLGFTVARLAVMKLTRAPLEYPISAVKEAGHAS